MLFWKASCLLSALSIASAKLTWGTTQFLFTFGDSYTTDGFNISAGVDSPVPGFTSSNGPNWVQFLGGTYNVTNTKVFNLASGGATIDAALVPPFEPTVLSIVDQVQQFHEILAPKPPGAEWNSSNSLFAFWIGINDVGNSFAWVLRSVGPRSTSAAITLSLLTYAVPQAEILYADGARSFLFLTVPPTNRAPLIGDQGLQAVAAITAALADYNAQLGQSIRAFQKAHRDLDQGRANGTPGTTTQIPPCAPVSSYFWLNSLHPLFTVHNVLARAVSTALSA
ncbi:hypothetical protein LXA43DRAFT_974873 [Ganoderma leucocontextum]|nr:hypothetical protein LXA43DRAFT_974873 [Ganoderma leucocontextum]